MKISNGFRDRLMKRIVTNLVDRLMKRDESNYHERLLKRSGLSEDEFIEKIPKRYDIRIMKRKVNP